MRLMSGSYVCGFNLMKSEYHEMNIIVIPSVKSEEIKLTTGCPKKYFRLTKNQTTTFCFIV